MPDRFITVTVVTVALGALFVIASSGYKNRQFSSEPYLPTFSDFQKAGYTYDAETNRFIKSIVVEVTPLQAAFVYNEFLKYTWQRYPSDGRPDFTEVTASLYRYDETTKTTVLFDSQTEMKSTAYLEDIIDAKTPIASPDGSYSGKKTNTYSAKGVTDDRTELKIPALENVL